MHHGELDDELRAAVIDELSTLLARATHISDCEIFSPPIEVMPDEPFPQYRRWEPSGDVYVKLHLRIPMEKNHASQPNRRDAGND